MGSELWQLIFTMAYKRNGVHKFQVTLHQPQKAKRNTGEREEREREREEGATCNGVACHPSLVVCAWSVAQQTLN